MKLVLPKKIEIKKDPIVLWIAWWVGVAPSASHWYCEIRNSEGEVLFNSKFREWNDAMMFFIETFLENFSIDTPYKCECVRGKNRKYTYNWFDNALRKYWDKKVINND